MFICIHLFSLDSVSWCCITCCRGVVKYNLFKFTNQQFYHKFIGNFTIRMIKQTKRSISLDPKSLDYQYNKISCSLPVGDSFGTTVLLYLLSKRLSFILTVKSKFSKPYLNSYRQRFSIVSRHCIMCSICRFRDFIADLWRVYTRRSDFGSM